jgi:hypothetical protein
VLSAAARLPGLLGAGFVDACTASGEQTGPLPGRVACLMARAERGRSGPHASVGATSVDDTVVTVWALYAASAAAIGLTGTAAALTGTAAALAGTAAAPLAFRATPAATGPTLVLLRCSDALRGRCVPPPAPPSPTLPLTLAVSLPEGPPLLGLSNESRVSDTATRSARSSTTDNAAARLRSCRTMPTLRWSGGGGAAMKLDTFSSSNARGTWPRSSRARDRG